MQIQLKVPNLCGLKPTTLAKDILLTHPFWLYFSPFCMYLTLLTSIFPIPFVFPPYSFTFFSFSSPFSNLFPQKTPADISRGGGAFSIIHTSVGSFVQQCFPYRLASAGAPASMQTSTNGPKPIADFLPLARLASSSHWRVLPKALQEDDKTLENVDIYLQTWPSGAKTNHFLNRQLCVIFNMLAGCIRWHTYHQHMGRGGGGGEKQKKVVKPTGKGRKRERQTCKNVGQLVRLRIIMEFQNENLKKVILCIQLSELTLL